MFLFVLTKQRLQLLLIGPHGHSHLHFRQLKKSTTDLRIYHKNPKISDTQKFAVITLKV